MAVTVQYRDLAPMTRGTHGHRIVAVDVTHRIAILVHDHAVELQVIHLQDHDRQLQPHAVADLCRLIAIETDVRGPNLATVMRLTGAGDELLQRVTDRDLLVDILHVVVRANSPRGLRIGDEYLPGPSVLRDPLQLDGDVIPDLHHDAMRVAVLVRRGTEGGHTLLALLHYPLNAMADELS